MLIDGVSVVGSCCCCYETPLPKTPWGIKKFIWLMLPHHCVSLKEVRTGTWRQELMQGPWGGGGLNDTLLIASSAWFLIEYPQWAGLSPHKSLIKTMPYRLAYNLILWRHLLNWGPLLFSNSSLYQVDIKLACTSTDIHASKKKIYTQFLNWK